MPPPSLGPTRPVIRWGIGDVIIGLALWLVGGIVAVVVLVAMGALDANEPDTTNLTVGVIVVSTTSGWIGLLGWPIVASWWKGQRSLSRDFGLSIRWIDLAWGALGGVAALAISAIGGMIWTVIDGGAPPNNTDFLPDRPDAATVVALVALIAVATPIVEELFFRGLFLRAVGRRWNLAVGVVISSAVFGLLHWQGGSFGHAVFIAMVTASYGAVFALLVIRADGRLGPSITAHMIVNTIGVAVALAA